MRNNISRSHLVKLIALGAVAAATGLASQQVAIATPATLGFYPATDIYAKKSFHLDVDTYGRGIKADSTVSTGLTYGIGPDKEGLLGRSEIGFDYLLSVGGVAPAVGTSKRFLFNAKTQLYSNEATGVRVVAGGWGLGSKAVAAPDVAYISGSKAFKFGRIHLGVANSLANKAQIAVGTDDDKFSVSAGFDRALTPKLSFAVDYYSGKNAYAGVQPTLYYAVNDKASFGLGLFHLSSSQAGSVGVNRNQMYICFDYNFGGESAAPAEVASPAAPKAAPATP